MTPNDSEPSVARPKDATFAVFTSEMRQHKVLDREGELELFIRYQKTGDKRLADQLVVRQPSPRPVDRQAVRSEAPRRARPRAGGEPRSLLRALEIRPDAGDPLHLVRLALDPRLHPQVHDLEPSPREARDHAGTAQAVLQPQEDAGAAGEGWVGGHGRTDRGEVRGARRGCDRDGDAVGRRSHVDRRT